VTDRIATGEAFRRAFDVSRETMTRLEAHRGLLEAWNRRINLVSRASLDDVWHRHFADSAQLWGLRPAGARHWLDLGAGAGFPGLVIAALAAEQMPGLRVTLVESDQRKAVFLRAAAQAADLAVTVLAERAERLPGQLADVVSARAVAPLSQLLALAEKHLAPQGICLFPKGGTVHKEIADARARWRFDHRMHPSRTDSRAAIVEIGAMSRA
jgi:16S rRNA (guanine527-N7)-methyltransferase